MKLCSQILLLSALLLPGYAAETSLGYTQDTINSSILNVKSDMQYLAETAVYNNIEVSSIFVKTIKTTVDVTDSTNQNNLLDLKSKLATKSIDSSDFAFVITEFDKLLVASAQPPSLSSIMQAQSKIAADLEKQQDQTIGKNTDELTPEEKKAMDKLVEAQNKLKQALGKLPQDQQKQMTPQQMDAIAQDIAQNKTQEAIDKIDKMLKGKGDKESKSEDKESESKALVKDPKGKTKEKGEEDLNSELKKLVGNWNAETIGKDHETITIVNHEAFPKRYETQLIAYYRELAN